MSIAALCGKSVDVVISGSSFFQGTLIEAGKDVLVLLNEERFVYIPLQHVHRINESSIKKKQDQSLGHTSLAAEVEAISYRTILLNAKGLFSEIYVTGNVSLHGYIMSVHHDYFAFYSPVYKTMLISVNHLKWLIPYDVKTPPYTLGKEKLSIPPTNPALLSCFEEQLKSWEGELAVFDMGEDPQKIGLIKKVSDSIIELIVANGETVYVKLSHIKSAHRP